MQTLTSKDGTQIAYDKSGQGPALILVDGAMTTRSSEGKAELVNLVAPHLTVYNYDRRGRGESGDTLPYAVEREIEDIEALIDNAGGTASLYGHSSGASLALDAAAALGSKVKKLAMYEAPYNDAPEAQQRWNEYIKQLTVLLATDRRGDAVALFMKLVGVPDDAIAGMRHSPMFQGLESVAPTLAYDHTAILGETAAVPTQLAASMNTPTLVMAGGASFPFMHETAQTLVKAMPHARLRMLEGQTHEVSPAKIAPVLIEFLAE